MNYLLELLKIEKNRLDWFLNKLNNLNIDIRGGHLFDLSKIELLLIAGGGDEEYVSAIRKIRSDYLLLIYDFKDEAKKFNDELEGRDLQIQEMIEALDFRDIAKHLFAIQNTANVDMLSPWKDPKYIRGLLASTSEVREVTESGYKSLYDKHLKVCLEKLLRVVAEMRRQHQMTDRWSRHELECYLSEIDLNVISDLIDKVEDLDGVQYELFCDRFDGIGELPRSDLMRENLRILSKEVVDFFCENSRVQNQTIYEVMLTLTEASVEYKKLESSCLLGPSFEAINRRGNIREDFKKTPLEKINNLMRKFKKHIIAAQRCYSEAGNLFPYSEMIKMTDFSRRNCLHYAKAYEELQRSWFRDLCKILEYSSTSKEFKLDIQKADFLSEKLSSWKRVPVPQVSVAASAASLFAQVFDAIDELLATSSKAPNSSQ